MGGQAGDRVLSPPMSPIASPALLHPSTPTPIFQRHSRRLSTSPAQLAVLSSQNEDLIQALGKLQDETSAADLDGKQRLRKLEKEIAGLRAELEQSHLKNGELEQRINSVQNDHERELELKKQERESKVHELRRSTSKAEAPPQTFANFAPTSNSPAKPNFSKPERSKDDDDSTPTRPALLPFPSSESQITVTSTRSPNPGEPSAELMILGQLLSKIEELESTNREILERHRENDSKLRTATNQSDALQKVYENLEDEVEDYADDEAGTFSADHSPLLESPPLGNGSPLFAFRGSFKGRGLGFLYPPSSQRVRSLKDRGSPVSSLRGKSAENLSEPLRKPLNASLFGDGPVADDSDHLDVNLDSELDDGAPTASRISALKSRYSKRRMRPKASLDAQMLSVTTSNAGLTPPLQRLRAHSSHQGFVNLTTSPPVVKQTLWSELNNDLGEDWQDEASKDDLSRNFENGGAEQDLNEDTITINPAAATKSERTIAEENRAVAAIRYALDPRNAGRPLDDGEHILPVGSLEGSPGESFFLLTHAVEARPNKWIVTAPKHRGLIQDSVSRMKHMALPPSMSLGAEAGEDPWETRYPEDSDTDVDAAGQVIRRGDRSVATRASNTDLHGGYASDVSVSQRRMAALWRLNNTANARSTGSMRRRRVGERFDEDEDTFNDDQDASREVARRGREMEIEGWGRTVMEIWIILQVSISLINQFWMIF